MRLRASVLWGVLLLAVASTPSLAVPAAPQPPQASTPAPVPDLDITQPPDSSGPARTSVGPGLVRPEFGPTAGSQGYTANSSYADTFDGRFRPMPGLRLSVPLQ